MKRESHFFICCLLLFNASCHKKTAPAEIQTSGTPTMETVVIDADSKVDGVNFEDIFSDYRLIPLETTEESLIQRIIRISFFEDRILILDSQRKYVMVFDSGGKFLNKIGRIGRGEGEYSSLMDFAIDKDSRQVILHSDRPLYALFRYDLNGTYIGKTKMQVVYNNIVCVDNDLLMANTNASATYLISMQNLETGNEQEFLPAPKQARIFHTPGRSVIGDYPYLLQSKGTFAYFLFSNQIYIYHDGVLVPKYQIDFGDKNLPERYYNGTFSADAIQKAARENEYGFKVGHFRETDNFLCFKYRTTVVIYSKKKKRSILFGTARIKDGLFFQGYFGDDGDDETLIGIYEGEHFARQMEVYRKNPARWSKVPDYVKSIAEKVDINSNPVLMQCTLRDDIEGVQ